MDGRLNILYNKKPCYDIVFSTGFQDLGRELEALEIQEKKLCVVTDSHVAALYGDEVISSAYWAAGFNPMSTSPCSIRGQTTYPCKPMSRCLRTKA